MPTKKYSFSVLYGDDEMKREEVILKQMRTENKRLDFLI